ALVIDSTDSPSPGQGRGEGANWVRLSRQAEAAKTAVIVLSDQDAASPAGRIELSRTRQLPPTPPPPPKGGRNPRDRPKGGGNRREAKIVRQRGAMPGAKTVLFFDEPVD